MRARYISFKANSHELPQTFAQENNIGVADRKGVSFNSFYLPLQCYFPEQKFESVGFSHEQSHAQSHESLKEFIRNEFERQIKDFDAKLGALETRIMISQKDLLIKIFGIIVGTVGIAVIILKLF